jgi:ABC-2 type transport system ATP-binding protein
VAEGPPDALKARLGTDWIEVSAAGVDDLARIADIGRRLTAAPVSVDGLRVRVPVADRTAAVLELAVLLREAGVTPADVEIRRPSLDEVFFALTGTAGPDDRQEVAA